MLEGTPGHPTASDLSGAARGTAVLVPGFTGSKEDFIAVLPLLLDAGYTVVALDLAGQNETPGRSDGDKYSLAGFADDVIAVAELYSDRPVHLVGHSLGGLICRAAATRHRFGSLTLLCSGPGPVPEEQRGRLQLFADVLDEHGADVLWQAMRALESEQGNHGPDDPRLAAFLAERFRRNDPRSLLAMVDILISDRPSAATPVGSGTPTLVITGQHDDVWWPSIQTEMAEVLGVRQVVIADAGHSPAVDRPEPTAITLTEFWQHEGPRP